jgi:hypothetical protein
LIRHAGGGQPLPVGPLAVPVIESSFDALLMTQVCGTTLLAASFGAAAIAAVVLSPVAGTADPERNAAVLSPTKPLTQNNFARVCHSRPKARLDISHTSWQFKAVCVCNLFSEGCSQWASVADTSGASYLCLPRQTTR